MTPLPMLGPLVSRALLLVLLTSPALEGQERFRPAAALLQLNDVYRIDAVENGNAGGLGRISTLSSRVRAETRLPTLLLHAGDFIAPSLESRYFAGIQMIDALNFLHARVPVVVVPGNHEFDERRPEMLTEAIRASRFAWLGSNLRMNSGDSAVDARVQRDTVISLGGMKVGIFALTFLDSPRSYASADSAIIPIARERIRSLERRGAEAIVALTHLDLADDRRIAALRRDHPSLVWVAGGHEHYLIRQEASDSSALITKGDSNARRVWKVLLGREGSRPAVRAEPVDVDASVPVDPRYAREITERYMARLREVIPFFDARIGTSATPLDGREDVVRDVESSWGNYLTDVMRGAFPDVRTDAAILNGGAIRIDDVVEGPIRWEHLQRTFGFPTRVGLVWLRGRDLRESVLERAVSGGRGEGRFLQLSGIRYSFDRQREPGSRVTSVEIGGGDAWSPLDDARVYVVAVPDYLYGGGDGYHFKDRAVLTVPPGPDLKLMVFDALSAALARGDSISPRPEGRIREAGRAPTER